MNKPEASSYKKPWLDQYITSMNQTLFSQIILLLPHETGGILGWTGVV